MLFPGKDISEIGEHDLLALIGESTESEDVDFKEFAYPAPPESELPEDQGERDRARNKWKTDLCTDVTALANSGGGWIICGMDEKGGIASELVGLKPALNLEREVARLEQCLMTGIEPPIPGLRIRSVPLSDADKSVILIRVPRSVNAPHRVRLTRRFHIRRSGRNDEMSIEELRAAFTLFDNLSERVRAFRQVRLQAILERDQESIPILLDDGPALVLHVVPLGFSLPRASVDLSVFGGSDEMWIHQHLHGGRFNLDGYVTPLGTQGFSQVFRDGAIECVRILPSVPDTGPASIDLFSIEDLSARFLNIALHTQQNLGVTLPVVLMLSITGSQGVTLAANRRILIGGLENPVSIQKRIVLLPDTLIESYVDLATPTNLTPILKPVFDVLWNIAGQSRSPSYSVDGNWARRRS